MNKIHFIKAGHQPPKHKSNPAGILHLISDWVLTSDFHNNYVFLFEITVTELHPEIVIFSKTHRCVVLLELTCHYEENMVNWYLIKLSKYSGLVEIIRSNEWPFDLFAVEVRAGGYPSQFLNNSLKRLGLQNKLSNSTVKNIGWISVEFSFYIWFHRHCQERTSQRHCKE